jgi:hypothetical protein
LAKFTENNNHKIATRPPIYVIFNRLKNQKFNDKNIVTCICQEHCKNLTKLPKNDVYYGGVFI